MSIINDLQTRYRSLSPDDVGDNETYKLLLKATPEWLIDSEECEPQLSTAWLIYNGEFHIADTPRQYHVEIAEKTGINDIDYYWFDTAIQGRSGVIAGFPAVSVYPHQIKDIPQLKHILNNIPISNNMLLTGFHKGVYKLADILATTRSKRPGSPGQKWWAPHSEGTYMFTDRLAEALDRAFLDRMMSPDYLLHNGVNPHSFFWSMASGLLVDPVAGRNHSNWDDEEFLEACSEFDCEDTDNVVFGRFAMFRDEPLVAIWYDPPDYTLLPTLRELIQYVGPKFTVSTDSKSFDFPPQHSKLSRTHKYWQLRQTSESKHGRPR